MPQYTWNPADLDAVTTALLSQTGPKPTSALQHLTVPKVAASYRAVGDFAEVYERYKCYACHRFNGYGGTLPRIFPMKAAAPRKSGLLNS